MWPQWAAEKPEDPHRLAAGLAKEVTGFSQRGGGGRGSILYVF